jgi:hypothetical protein
MIKPKSKQKLSKEENLRKEHREYLKKQGVPLDKDYRNMTYEEKRQYQEKAVEQGGRLALQHFEYSPGGIGFKSMAAGIKLARNPKMAISKVISGYKKAKKVVKKLVGKTAKTKKSKRDPQTERAIKDYKKQSTLQRGERVASKSRTGKMDAKGNYTPARKSKTTVLPPAGKYDGPKIRTGGVMSPAKVKRLPKATQEFLFKQQARKTAAKKRKAKTKTKKKK